MQPIKNTIYRRWQLIFFVLILGMVPSVAHAHGAERIVPYVGVPAFIIGLIIGIICTFTHVSLRYAISRSFTIYLIILMVVGFYILSEEISWSDIHMFVIMSLAVGFSFGLIPLVLGTVVMSFLLNRFIKRK